MILLRLTANESVRLTAQRSVQIWVARNHIEDRVGSGKVKKLVFLKKDITPGDTIIIDGSHNAFLRDGAKYFHARIYDVGINIDRHGIGSDRIKREAAFKILPFQYEMGNKTFRVESIHTSEPVRPYPTKPIKPEVFNQMIAAADLLPTAIQNELQSLR